MTVTFRRLVGTRENLDVLIHAHLIVGWNAANTGTITPTIEAWTYTPEKHIEEVDMVDSNRILCHLPLRTHEEDEEDEPLGDCSHKWTTSVQIEVWSESEVLLGLFEDEINRILWEAAPTTGLRLKKSDGLDPPIAISGTDSEVEYFQGSEIEFGVVESEDESPDRVGSQGVLKCVWYKDKTV